MILDRSINLPTNVGGAELCVEAEDGSFVFRAWFTNLNFSIDHDEVTVKGDIILRKYRRKTRPRWQRFFSFAFKRFQSETTDKNLWSIGDTYNRLIGFCMHDAEQQLINAGLKQNILLHRSLLDQVLDNPRNRLREVYERVAPEIMGRPREAVANAA